MRISEPRWLEFDRVVTLHDQIVAIYGSAGFPFPGYLDSALSAPKNFYWYHDGGFDLFDLAAVYLYHIAQAHAFTDGNKRTAYIAALVFLGVNGIDVVLPTNMLILARATVRAVEGRIGKIHLARTMRVMPRLTRPKHRPSGKSRRRKRRKRML